MSGFVYQPGTSREESDHPWVRSPISERRFLIVAGTYRSGTTSVFNYLQGHPEVAASSVKEPAFFFSARWRQQPPAYPPGREVESYLSLFKATPASKVWLEATPNYLHEPGCARRIRFALPNARIVVLLRDPVERLKSWHKHTRLIGQLPEHVPLAAWIEGQLRDTRPLGQREYVECALAHGRYAPYVGEYLQEFGRDRVLVVWFDDLNRNPRDVMRRICDFAGLDPAYFETYDFTPQNESMEFRDRRWFTYYLRVRRALGAPFRSLPRVRFRLKRILHVFEPYYVRLLVKPAEEVEISAALRAELRTYYREDTEALERLVGREVPWKSAP